MDKYCEAVWGTKRRRTREVWVGNVGIGGNHPIRVQSMTTSDTRNVESTIDQVIRLADAGCEIVRVTVQGIKEAESCEQIKNGLLKRGYTIPLVADIHFFPPAAMRVVDFVDKVRINPGNYSDRRASFKKIEYDDETYAQELTRLEEKFAPLVEKCKRLKKAMRIGTNHGSLSDRMMNRFGDTPRGMVESALEFARVCRKYDYHDFLFSMKSSNPKVMIAAYRLLTAEMLALNWDYPLHLGVTEAGEGEEGRIKSAIGIGALLLDGIGDTVRVSLTEDPWKEIDPCKRLVTFAEKNQGRGVRPLKESWPKIESIEKRKVIFPENIPLHKEGTVFISAKSHEILSKEFEEEMGWTKTPNGLKKDLSSTDCLIIEDHCDQWVIEKLKSEKIPSLSQATQIIPLHSKIESGAIVLVENDPSEKWEPLEKAKPALIFLSPKENRLHYSRKFFDWIRKKEIDTPVILSFAYHSSKEDLIIEAAAECGSLLCDGLGEGLWIRTPYEKQWERHLSLNLLQAARMRTSKTEFISCPGCGRTLFDLQEVSKKIREKTAHLAGVKIAIMGCIVNGPGEMADADFGYVGSKTGMIDLYIGKECVEKEIPFANAEERLISLIKQQGRWVEPSILPNATS